MSPHDSLAVHPDRSERSPTKPFQVPLDSAFDRLKMNSIAVDRRRGITAAEGHGASTSTGWPRQRCTKSPRLRQLAEWKETNKINPKLFLARLGAVKLHFSCCQNILDVGLFTRLWLCLTVSPVRSTHDQCTRQASDMTCDSDVIEKPSRRWRGAVQQLADVVWES